MTSRDGAEDSLVALAPRSVASRRVGDVLYLESTLSMPVESPVLGELLERAAARAPDRDFLIERRASGLRRVTFAQALGEARAVAAWLAATGRAGRPVLALSGNSIDHALVMLGCFVAGTPFVPVSVAYSLLSRDFEKLRRIVGKVRPGVVFVDDPAAYGGALSVVLEASQEPPLRMRSGNDPNGADVALGVICEQRSAPPGVALDPDCVAKILFTSGSTGFPKGVPNTHRMLVANQQMIAALWPFIGEGELVLVDWLPWSHTFGGNHNFNMALLNAGTLVIDHGRPTPDRIAETARNLREFSPTIYFNVPAGYAALVPLLESDGELCERFFAKLRVLFYAAAALPEDLWRRLARLAERSAAGGVFMTTAWGSTETSPLSTSAHFALERPGNIGLPAPGVTLKLVPNGSKLEVRVRGPHVMAGYVDEPELTLAAFDEEGFYRIGDAVKLADPNDPSRGLVFDGRVAEDFKLMTGTWVSVTAVRTGVLAEASPVLADLVVAGQDRGELAVLAWPNPAGCRPLVGAELGIAELVSHPAIVAHVRDAIRRWNTKNPESSARVGRALLLHEAASIDAGEITDKGYVNQRATLERRASLVEDLYAGRVSSIITMDAKE